MSSMAIESTYEIGGYFGLDLPDHGDPFPGAIKFQSARAALRAVIEYAGIETVLLPSYICDSVIQAVVDAGAVVDTYCLDDALYPKGLSRTLPDKSVLLYVNYFGLCEANIARLLLEIPRKQLIIDNCQALFAPPTGALVCIYSPRKFIGIPDGGLLFTSGPKIEAPMDEDNGSIERMKHLLLRLAYTARDGYPDFVESEKTLRNTKPLQMSRLTKRILSSIDISRVKSRRQENFAALAKRLNEVNYYQWKLNSDSIPLCYPLILDSDTEAIRMRLIRKGIFIPTYWPETKQRVSDPSVEHRLANCCLPLPIDHRYTPRQMNYLADIIVEISFRKDRC